jgi:glc operon protein GlcG
MITLEQAKKIAAKAEQVAAGIPCAMTIVILDSGANLVYAGRMDNGMIGSVEAARRKARSAVLFKRPTKAFEEALAGGRMAILSLPEAMPIEGGVPLTADGQLLGAIGVSGGTAQQDGMVANAAVEFFAGQLSGRAHTAKTL